MDLRIQAIALRDGVSRHQNAPAAETPGPAARAVWEAVVKPRLAPRVAGLERLADAASWVLDDEDRAVRLQPAQWDEAIAALGDLYAASAEGARLYRTLRFEAAPPPGDGPKGKGPKGKAPRGKGAQGKRGKGKSKVKSKGASPAAIDPALTVGIAEDRAALEGGMAMVRSTLARLQKAEEARLKPDCEVCFEGDRETAEKARVLFDRMRVGRLNAESFAGEPPEHYATLVKEGWRAPHRELLALLGLGEAASLPVPTPPPTLPPPTLPPPASPSTPAGPPMPEIAGPVKRPTRGSGTPASTRGRPKRAGRRPRRG